MKPEEVLLGILALTLVISGTYIVTTQSGGFFDSYGYTPPTNTLSTKYDKLSSVNSIYENMTGAYGSEKPSGLDYLNRLLMGASSVIETIYNTVTIPVMLIADLATDLGIPLIVVQVASVAFAIVFFMGIIYLIFRMTN